MRQGKSKPAHTAKPKRSSGDSHVSHSSLGMGDYYGTGTRNPIGKMKEGNGMRSTSKAKIKTPPKGLA